MDGQSLWKARQQYAGTVPDCLRALDRMRALPLRQSSVDGDIRQLLRHTGSEWVLGLVSGGDIARKSRRVGVLFSGGPAPGGHTVVAGLYDGMMALGGGSLLGFLGGPKGLLRNEVRELSRQEVDAVRNSGGFDLIGTGRTKIASSEEMAQAIESIRKQDLDGLVVIGGDDSNTDAALLAETGREEGLAATIIGVPKTIDGDLQSQEIAIPFGFDTACATYSETIGNIAKDLLSTKKYYFFIRLMGREASHITLECALRTRPNLALISEEVVVQQKTLRDLVNDVADFVEERHHRGKSYGVILVPEGLIEHLVDIRQLIDELNEMYAKDHPVSSLLRQCGTNGERLRRILGSLSSLSRDCLLLLPDHVQERLTEERDSHGNVQVSRVETERLLATLVGEELRAREEQGHAKVPFSFQTTFCGYEGRSAFPSNFDCTYCYALGLSAASSVALGLSGHMVAINRLDRPPAEWEPCALPFSTLLHFERRGGTVRPVIRKTFVDLAGPLFRLFDDARRVWRTEDQYQQSGPAQFFGPSAREVHPPLTVQIGRGLATAL